VSVSSFSFVNNPLFNLTLMCFWCHMPANRAVSAALHTPTWGVKRLQGPKIQTPHHKFWLARGTILSLIWHANRKRLPAPGLERLGKDWRCKSCWLSHGKAAKSTPKDQVTWWYLRPFLVPFWCGGSRIIWDCCSVDQWRTHAKWRPWQNLNLRPS